MVRRRDDRLRPRPRDLPVGGRPVTLVWVKRVWRCMEAACPVSTWSEVSAGIRPRASWTERARAEACRRVGEDGHSVAQVASSFGVAWATVMDAVVEYGTPRVDDPQRLDEPCSRSPGKGMRRVLLVARGQGAGRYPVVGLAARVTLTSLD